MANLYCCVYLFCRILNGLIFSSRFHNRIKIKRHKLQCSKVTVHIDGHAMKQELDKDQLDKVWATHEVLSQGMLNNL